MRQPGDVENQAGGLVDGVDSQLFDDAVEASAPLREVVEQMASGFFSPEEPHRYGPLVDLITGGDYFLVAADFDAYFETQRRIDADFRDADAWSRMAALNTAHSGWFSSDRTIRGYMSDIWNVEPVG